VAADGRPLPPALSAPGFDLPDRLMVFDGVCVLCNGGVRFVLAHEKEAAFSFTPEQSALGQRVLAALGRPPEGNDSVVVIDAGRYYLKSDAVFQLAYSLKAPWSWAVLLRFCPRVLRDWIYDLVARNRYGLFGRYDRCLVPDAALRRRFPE